MAEKKKEEKMILETLKPGAEITELERPPEFIEQWLAEDVNVWKMLAEMLKAEGVEYVFGLIAGATAQPEFEMLKQGIKRVHVRHESTATFAAEGWARLAGRPGVAYTGPGTGITNATTGVVQGLSAASPCVILAFGDLMMADNLVMGQGIARGYKLYDGISKYAIRIGNPFIMPFEVKRAFRSAMAPPTGPVCVEFCGEFGIDQYRHGPRMSFLMGYNPLTWSGRSEIPKRAADPQMLEKTMEWFFEAERPAIVAGEHRPR